MQDPFSRGLVAGMAGVVAINLAELIMRGLNISKTTLWQAAGQVFLSPDALKSPLGITVGVISHILVTLFVATAISYFIYFTGPAWAVFKGMWVSLFFLFVFVGWALPARKIIMSYEPKDVISAIINHLIVGLVAGYLIKYFQLKFDRVSR